MGLCRLRDRVPTAPIFSSGHPAVVLTFAVMSCGQTLQVRHSRRRDGGSNLRRTTGPTVREMFGQTSCMHSGQGWHGTTGVPLTAGKNATDAGESGSRPLFGASKYNGDFLRSGFSRRKLTKRFTTTQRRAVPKLASTAGRRAAAVTAQIKPFSGGAPCASPEKAWAVSDTWPLTWPSHRA